MEATTPAGAEEPRLTTEAEVEAAMWMAHLDGLEEGLGPGSELGPFYPQHGPEAGDDAADRELRRAVARATRGGALVRYPSPLWPSPAAQRAAVEAALRRAEPIMEVLARRDDIVATSAESPVSKARTGPGRECDACGEEYGPAAFLALPFARAGEHDVSVGHDVRRCPCGDVAFLPLPYPKGERTWPWHRAFRDLAEEARGLALAHVLHKARPLLLRPDLPWRRWSTGDLVVAARLRVPLEGPARVVFDGPRGRASLTLRAFLRRFAPAPKSLPRVRAFSPDDGPEILTVVRERAGLVLVAHEGARERYDLATGRQVALAPLRPVRRDLLRPPARLWNESWARYVTLAVLDGGVAAVANCSGGFQAALADLEDAVRSLPGRSP